MSTEINLTGVKAAEEQAATTATTFKRVQPGVQTLTIASLEETKSSQKGTPGLKVTFDSKEAEASFFETFWLTEGALPRLQHLIEKFTGAALEGSFDIAGLSAVLVGKSQPVVVDGRVVGVNKDGKWYNNTYPQLRYAGYVNPQGADAEPRIDRSQEINLEAANNPDIQAKPDANDDLPF